MANGLGGSNPSLTAPGKGSTVTRKVGSKVLRFPRLYNIRHISFFGVSFNYLGGSNNFAIIDTQEQNKTLKTIMDSLQITDQKYRPQYVASILGNLKNQLIGPKGYAEGKARGIVDDKIVEIFNINKKPTNL